MSSHRRWFAGLAAALMIPACNSSVTDPVPKVPVVPVPPLGTYDISVSLRTLSIAQGGNAAVGVVVSRTNFTSNVTLAVDIGDYHGTMPPGVTASWTPNPVSGSASLLTLRADTTTAPGVYDLVVFGVETPPRGVVGGAPLRLTVFPKPVPPLPPDPTALQQWAITANASSEWDVGGDWGAQWAIGASDGYGWSSYAPSTVEWLEVTYATPVQPTLIRVFEVLLPGCIVKIEVKDVAGHYATVYTAAVTPATAPRTLEVPVTGVTAKVVAVRITVDQSVLGGWTEIDAVQLVGRP